MIGNDVIGVVVCLAAVSLVAVVLLTWAFRGRRAHRLPVVPKPVLTKAEVAFYRRLVRAAAQIGGIDVFPQVAMGAIMDAERGLEAGTRQSVRNRFDRKIVDFVIVDDDANVLLLVELDDRTHDAAKDRLRDEITAAAGYSTMRIRGREARDAMEIERQLRIHLR